ncbi:MAG: radical SAM protein [Alphaproteobacteria bacterium]
MNQLARPAISRLDPRKFRDPDRTADGEPRARVALGRLATLWFNTGTLCNLTCRNCYIESSPTNDRLVYISAAEVAAYLDEIARDRLGTEEIGFTGGEPFMNPEFMTMLEDSLARGFRAMVLTNAMTPMWHHREALLRLREIYGTRLVLRVSLDHYTPKMHELERGVDTWAPTLRGLDWLAANGFALHVAGRTYWGESDESMRRGFARLFAEHGYPVDADDPVALVLFPEMDATADIAEITTACWGILGVAPEAVMCASSRMVVKRKGAAAPGVLACTLLAYDPRFELGATLADAAGPVPLNHPHCARFCVLGGGSCGRVDD